MVVNKGVKKNSSLEKGVAPRPWLKLLSKTSRVIAPVMMDV